MKTPNKDKKTKRQTVPKTANEPDHQEISKEFDFIEKGSELQGKDIKITWIIDEILPENSITLIHAPGGLGKSFLALRMGGDISDGTNFLGLNTLKRPVLYVDYENSYEVIVERSRMLGLKEIRIWHGRTDPTPPKMDSGLWEQLLRLPKGCVVIFDTLRASNGKDENSSLDMTEILNKFKTLRNNEMTIVILHHESKSNKNKSKGSTAILDQSDHVLCLEKNRDGSYRLGTIDKTRYKPGEVFMGFHPEKAFVPMSDPDDEKLERLHALLTEQNQPINQSQFLELIVSTFKIAGRGAGLKLIHKGDGRFWQSHKECNRVLYVPVSSILS